MAAVQGPWEIIFINDGSTDGGGELLKSLILDTPVRVLDLERNSGQTTALYAGLQAAGGEIIATLDADLQNPPEEIPRLAGLMEGFDMVTGFRAQRRDGWVKRASSN